MTINTNEIPKLPRWALAAFTTRCAQRFLELYENDNHEPQSSRIAVSQAVLLSEARCNIGGDPDLIDAIQIKGQFFDNYDIVSLDSALYGCDEAANNTYADLSEDPTIENEARRIWTAIKLARFSLLCSFNTELSHSSMLPADLGILAAQTAVWGEPSLTDDINGDIKRLLDLALTKGWTDEDPVTPSQAGPLWPKGRPAGWPHLQLSFKPRARIIRTIGDRLISGPEAAVIELVKNSYDADASTVRITIRPPQASDQGEIFFEDDGHGMTLKDIQEKWMEPATSNKRERKHSPNGRRLLGSKGIGRFAAARLGRFLELTSTALEHTSDSASELTAITTRIPNLDWNDFEETEYLEDVLFPVETKLATSDLGTKLRIHSLRDPWPQQRVLRLHQELRRLVSPIPSAHTKPFRIFLDISKCTKETCGFDGLDILMESSGNNTNNSTENPDQESLYEVRPFPILEACDYTVDGLFDEHGTFAGTMTIRRGGMQPEKIRLTVPLKEAAGEDPCGVVRVSLYIFDREAQAIRSTAEKAGFGKLGVREARKLLDSIAGVAIYREGFRIRPYGDGENDWLTLDAKRVQNPTLKIGRNQIAGIIGLDDEETSGLVERSSREGLEENGSFRRLQGLISTLLAEVVEPKRRQFRITAGLDERNDTTFKDVYKHSSLDWSRPILEKLPDKERNAAQQLITQESDRLTQYLKRLEERQAQLEAQVTLGLIIGEVMHQGNTPLSFLETEAARLLNWWPSIDDDTEEAEENRADVPIILNGMVASGTKLRVLFDALSPLSGAQRGDPRPYKIAEVLANTVYLFKTKLEKANIVLSIHGETDLEVTGYPDDLATAATNLIDNAIYWLEHHQIFQPSIEIDISSYENRCFIDVADNGVGASTEFEDQLFNIGFTMKPSGTGLGLSIAREAIFRSGGELTLQPSVQGAKFRISLPIN